MSVKSLIVLSAILGLAGTALAVDTTILGNSWTGNPPASYNGWVGTGQWGSDPGGNGWNCGDGGSGRGLRTQAGQAGYGGMTYALNGMHQATLTNTNFTWRSFGGTYANNQIYPNGEHPDASVGTALLSLELNGVGVALTVISDANSTRGMWDFNNVDLSDNAESGDRRASAVYYSGYNPKDLLLQLVQYSDIGGANHYKVLATYDLAQWGTSFRGTTPWWGITASDSLSIVGNKVSASFSSGANTWTVSDIALSPLGGTIGEKAIWGSGSYAFRSGLDSATGNTNVHLTADTVPEPASLCLLALGLAFLSRRR
jgi:hypothetical protein